MTTTNHHETDQRALRLDSPLLKPEQAAELLAVRTSWIYEAVRTNRLPCTAIARTDSTACGSSPCSAVM